MNRASPEVLFSIIADLRKARISFSLEITREEAVTILAAVPGQRWEIDIFNNGDIEVEIFRSKGEILDMSQLVAMIRQFTD